MDTLQQQYADTVVCGIADTYIARSIHYLFLIPVDESRLRSSSRAEKGLREEEAEAEEAEVVQADADASVAEWGSCVG